MAHSLFVDFTAEIYCSTHHLKQTGMKSATTLIFLVALLLSSITIQGVPEENSAPGNNELIVVYSPQLESLANQLVSVYKKGNRDFQIQVTPLIDLNDFKNLEGGAVALINKDGMEGLVGENYLRLVVGRDAIVPVMNINHPQRELIMEKGISPEGFARIYLTDNHVTWGEILGISGQQPVHAFVPGISSEKEYLAEFLQTASTNINGLVMTEPEELIGMIGSDPFAIGFCSLNCLIKMENNGLNAEIGLVPVDMDGDGRIGTFEDIYRSTSTLSHAMFVGRFPKALYSSIYAVTDKQLAGDQEKAFLEWLINSGQETLASAGMLALGNGERNSRREQLLMQDRSIYNVTATAPAFRIILAGAGFFLLLGLLFFFLVRISGRKRIQPDNTISGGERSAAFPGGLFFDRTHTWTFMEKSGMVRIGVDNFLPHITGPLTRVLIKQPGQMIKKGEHFLTLIQNGKRLEIKSPVSGVVIEQNMDLIGDASLLNSDPFSAGWVMMVEPLNWLTELKSYFMGQPYAEWLRSELTRLKEYFTSTLKTDKSNDPALVLQDGGEINEGVLRWLGPEVWEEFQAGFINKTN